jgi:DNA-directed RNA polymerase specialized sigma24 family protein
MTNRNDDERTNAEIKTLGEIAVGYQNSFPRLSLDEIKSAAGYKWATTALDNPTPTNLRRRAFQGLTNDAAQERPEPVPDDVAHALRSMAADRQNADALEVAEQLAELNRAIGHLAPPQGQIAAMLLAGSTERQIAAAFGRSPFWAHQMVTDTVNNLRLLVRR